MVNQQESHKKRRPSYERRLFLLFITFKEDYVALIISEG